MLFNFQIRNPCMSTVVTELDKTFEKDDCPSVHQPSVQQDACQNSTSRA